LTGSRAAEVRQLRKEIIMNFIQTLDLEDIEVLGDFKLIEVDQDLKVLMMEAELFDVDVELWETFEEGRRWFIILIDEDGLRLELNFLVSDED
jgi:hypothetical protein